MSAVNIPHQSFMLRCIELGRLALENGNPPVGSLLVVNGEIIGEASEESHTTGDVTDHAEIVVLRRKIQMLDNLQRASAILYSTHEPCVMCSYVIRQYGIGTIVFGCKVPHMGGFSSKYNLLNESTNPSWKLQPVVVHGILADECIALTRDYEKRKSKKT